ncbi:MAG: hypothetical protein HOP34_01680 [Methylococcaceae bacterium]|nr:hypothetical protein [Methylococcaceae bacterium]
MPYHYDPAFVTTVRPSKHLCRWLIAMHTLALLACWANAWPGGLKLLASVAVCASAAWTVRQTKAHTFTLKHSNALAWQIQDDSGWHSIDILQSTVITRFAVFLHYQYKDKNRVLGFARVHTHLILSDALPEDAYRQLLVKVNTTAIK